ncbi:hypothetical protein D9758_013299 [Tetrapyrgos nigripes]|uniref:Uncharacterized protein n=1 Tax=Tetrapyrgos nigripes TaxID=182062 RepID=A0A8H5FJV2_9AGAR|nr:hypothetical protein D9758_013299 [Tetrapyrgos nigripes]
MSETLDDPAKLYMTRPFTENEIEHLLSLVHPSFRLQVQSYAEDHYGLSPLQLFRRLEDTYFGTGHPYFIIADERTHQELFPLGITPTVIVAGIWSNSPEDEWDLYRGSVDLDSLPEQERLDLLRQLAEQRAQQEADESGNEEWAWQRNFEQHGTDAKLWQIKTIRADLKGMVDAGSVYDVKDRDLRDSHKTFVREAQGNGGVYGGL